VDLRGPARLRYRVQGAEFHQRSFLLGPPPKVVWIRRGNCSTGDIETLLRQRHPDLLAFDADPDRSFLALS
jgi:predicted nuclease of predicted toxin-antitoxin system